jgi:hypothetical protein
MTGRIDPPYRVGPMRITYRLESGDYAALTNREPKLSRIPPAHWRNVYEYAPSLLTPAWCEAARLCGAEELAPGIWRASTRHVSRKIAETKALEYLVENARRCGPGAARHLRAEKFEGEAP